MTRKRDILGFSGLVYKGDAEVRAISPDTLKVHEIVYGNAFSLVRADVTLFPCCLLLALYTV